MADKIFRVKKGSRIVIEVAKPQNSGSKPASQAKGIIKPRREPEYLARRKTAQNGINFIDVGQTLIDGILVSNGAMLIPDTTIFSDTILAQFNVTDADREGFISDIETEVFAEFGEDYQSKFYKIQKSDEPFSKSITAVFERGGDTIVEKLNDLPEWKAGGLVLNQSQVEHLTIQPDGRLYAIGNINFGNLAADIDRITLTHDIEAENVTFTPSPKMDVLLMPAPLFSYSFAHYKDGIHTFTDGDGTHTDFIRKGDYLNFFYHVLNRQFWADLVEIEESGLSLYQQSYRIWQIQKQFASARMIRLTYDFHEYSPYSYFTVKTSEPVEDFPRDAIYGDADAPVSGGSGVANEDFQAAEVNDLFDFQKLKFIIRKSGVFYYFWKT